MKKQIKYKNILVLSKYACEPSKTNIDVSSNYDLNERGGREVFFIVFAFVVVVVVFFLEGGFLL